MPALVTLLVGLYKITGPSFTRDESATLAAVHRSFLQLVSTLGHVDVVHGANYALIWFAENAREGTVLTALAWSRQEYRAGRASCRAGRR